MVSIRLKYNWLSILQFDARETIGCKRNNWMQKKQLVIKGFNWMPNEKMKLKLSLSCQGYNEWPKGFKWMPMEQLDSEVSLSCQGYNEWPKGFNWMSIKQ